MKYAIQTRAFKNCTSLKQIDIPYNSVSSIESNAFSGCTSLKKIVFSGVMPSMLSDTFDGVTATAWYPADVSSWDGVESADYGGDITWVCEDAILITAQPQKAIAAENETACVFVEAEGAELTYAWYAAQPGSDEFALCEDVTTNAFNITMNETVSGTPVYCVVGNSYGNTVQTEIATLEMAVYAAVTQQPQDILVFAGERQR